MIVTGLQIHVITSRISAGGTPEPNLITGGVTIAVAAYAVVVTRRARLTLEPEALIVCNGLRTHRFPLPSITRVSPLSYGVLIYYRDGERHRHISALASQGLLDPDGWWLDRKAKRTRAIAASIRVRLPSPQLPASEA